MPNLTWNSTYWAGVYNWQTAGEEWSITWGGSEPQWFGSLYPRLRRFIPAGAILEIAPGFGRWTKFLLPACQDYVGVDLSEECIAACRSTFSNIAYARFIQNNGLSLADAPDGHFDFVFSFDSLVHVESDVMGSYVPQILQKLTPDGVAFIHHSNLAALGPGVENPHLRGESVSAEVVADMVRQAGGKILVQERVNWGNSDVNDCLTLLARHEHPDIAPPSHIKNVRFMDEATIIRDTHAPYARRI
jgi:SAM-dependent methyltransferase